MVDTTSARNSAVCHGADVSRVQPPSRLARLELLAKILRRKDVPYPIQDDVAREYYLAAEAGVPFAIGSLSNATVDLAGFENTQVFEDLSMEDHMSWAFLVADQQATKHRYACQEYLRGEQMFEIGGNTIPDYYILNARIYQQTQ